MDEIDVEYEKSDEIGTIIYVAIENIYARKHSNIR